LEEKNHLKTLAEFVIFGDCELKTIFILSCTSFVFSRHMICTSNSSWLHLT